MRKGLDRVVITIAWTSTFLACSALVALAVAILGRGLPSIDLAFLTEPMRASGAAGGIWYQLVGTLLLIGSAGAVCTPLALGTALTHSFYLRSNPWRRRLELALFALNGTPSILFGIAGLIVLCGFFGWGKSWLAGGIVLAFVMLPTVTITLIERIESIPNRYIEEATALGLTQDQIARAVVLPQSAGALATGLVLGLARAAGETAPVLFTASIFAGATIPTGIHESPVLALPYHLFVLAQDSFDPALRERVWGTATVLFLLVLLLSAVALPWRVRLHEEARDG